MAQTSVEWLIKEILKHDKSFVEFYGAEIEQAKEIHKATIIDELIGFQIFLNEKGSITDYDWDFEKVAKEYVKKTYKK